MRHFLMICVFCCLVFALVSPQTFSQNAAYGLHLWYTCLVPTLLPFLILTGLFRSAGSDRHLNQLLAPFTRRFLHLPEAYGSVLLFGLLSGLPITACGLACLPKAERLENASYPLLLASHLSPGFLTGFVLLTCLEATFELPLLLLSTYGINILFALLFFRPRTRPKTSKLIPPATSAPLPEMLSNVFTKSLTSICVIGIYVMFFSILAGFLALLSGSPVPLPIVLLTGLCEVTNGCAMLHSKMPEASLVRSALTAFFISFGGLSGIAQAKAMLGAYPLPLFRFLGIKIGIATVSAVTMPLLLTLFKYLN